MLSTNTIIFKILSFKIKCVTDLDFLHIFKILHISFKQKSIVASSSQTKVSK